jgi:hypothetical protein
MTIYFYSVVALLLFATASANSQVLTVFSDSDTQEYSFDENTVIRIDSEGISISDEAYNFESLSKITFSEFPLSSDIPTVSDNQTDVYPNPFQRFVKVGGNYTSADIFMANGLKLKSINIPEDSRELDLAELPQGLYYFTLKSATNSFTQTLIKE